MEDKDFCKKCNKKHSCRDVYEKIGKSNSPPVTVNVIKAFVLPVILFIISVVLLDDWVSNITNNHKLQIVLQIVLAVLITSLVIILTKILKKLFIK